MGESSGLELSKSKFFIIFNRYNSDIKNNMYLNKGVIAFVLCNHFSMSRL